MKTIRFIITTISLAAFMMLSGAIADHTDSFEDPENILERDNTAQIETDTKYLESL